MELIGFSIVVILSLLLLFFIVENIKIKKHHENEVVNLKSIITDLLFAQNQQKNALQLSDELKIKLQTSRVVIDEKMISLQNDLISKLIDNNLVE